MNIKLTVLKEDSRMSGNVEYVTVTGMEQDKNPLLQMLDYSLRADEREHKGKLVGKVIVVQVDNIRAIFAGRPQLSGKIVTVS